MEPSDGNKPGKTSGSGEYSLMLNRTLRREDEDKRRSARQAFEEARQSSEPTAADSVDLPPPRPPMTTDPEIPAAKEVKQATIALTASVDQICEGLVLVFGEMKTVTTTLAAITRVLLLLMIGQMIAFGFMGYMVWRLESVVVQADQTRKEQAQTTAEIANLKRSSEATKRTVDEVKSKADEAPKVEIIADQNKPGTAVVRILPPTKSSDPDPAPPVPSVDIPLNLDGARPSPRAPRSSPD